MATFPSLQPSSRVYSPGEYPHTRIRAWSGAENRVRHSNVFLESTLKLAFIGLSEAEMLSLLSHYQGQSGTFESFAIPSLVWSGITSTSSYSPTNYRWRYVEPPMVTDLPCGTHDVELSLVTVPPEGVTINGLNRIVTFSIAGGVVRVSNGITATVAVQFAPGLGDAPVNASGATFTITTSIAGGTATGGATVAGMNAVVNWSISGGVSSLTSDFGLTAVIEDDLLNLGF